MKAYYIVGTHWDREWYEPFQEFRRWLVELVDELIDLMERDPEYCCFHLDGQTIVLEDYLEIRPERREALLKLLRERRLVAGPWYNLPDEWLVSGEALVRNLSRGRRLCRELGFEPMDFAYTPDQFGHIAALPMIMKAFGLSAGICWRGTQDETHPAHFAWVGPDGGKLPCHKLIDKGSYANFDFAVRRPLMNENYAMEGLPGLFDAFIKDEQPRTAAPLLLLLDAVDHQRPDTHMPAILAALRTQYPDITFVWDTLEAYGRELAQHLESLPERRGELREPLREAHRPGQYLIVHTISSRYDIKRQNDLCQNLLEKWAEPLLVFEMLDGGKPVPGFLEKAWQYLLRNHPHDSICGCSVDQVHRDMHYRFDQARLLGDGCVRRSMARIATASAATDDWRRIALHNPLPYPQQGVFDVALFFPADHGEKTGQSHIDGLAWSERYNKFHLVLPDGARVPYQHVRVERRREHPRLDKLGRPQTVLGDVYHVAVELALPPCGFITMRIEPTDDATRTFGSLTTGPLSASNGLIDFELRADGAGRLTDHAANRTFDDLFLYEDSGEVGDGWTRGQPLNDVVYRSPGAQVMTALEEDGPLRTVFRVDRVFSAPRAIDQKTGWRSTDRVDLRITDYITVAKHSPALLVKTVVRNNALDHRLRVLFPSRVQADVSFADTPFALVERAIPIPVETAAWQERVNPEKAFTSLFGVQDARGGLAVICPAGHHEYAVLETPERTLALTLLRSFRKTVNQPEEPDGQLQGDWVFEYALYPFAGKFQPVAALQFTAALQAGIRTHTAAADTPHWRSCLALECGAALVTALKPAQDGQGAVIRFWNPTQTPINDGFKIHRPFREVWECTIDETPVRRLQPGDGFVPVTVPAGGLYTVRFSW